MLGRGLESLIPSGGYKKPEDQQNGQPVGGQAFQGYQNGNVPRQEANDASPVRYGAMPDRSPIQSQAQFGGGQQPSLAQGYDGAQSFRAEPERQPVPSESQPARMDPNVTGGYPIPPASERIEQNQQTSPYAEDARNISQHAQSFGAAMPQTPQVGYNATPSYNNIPPVKPIEPETFREPAVVYPKDNSSVSENRSIPSPVNPSYDAAPGYPQAPARETLPIKQEYIPQYDDDADYSRKQDSVFQIEVEKIFPNPHQPRRHFDEDALNELASSIREFGIIQPLVVTKVSEETDNGTNVTYQLIAGERRLMAAKKVGLRTVPAVVKKVGMDRERLELAIIENIQRENLNPLEAARSYARLQDEFGLTQREIAIRMGKSRETVANTLRLLNLPSEIQQALEEGKINESHARLLLQIGDISRQKDMFQSILRFKPSVRELKAKIRSEKKTGGNYMNPELTSLQTRLEEFLGTKVHIDDEGDKGKITINYYSPEELNALISRLSGEEYD